MKTLLTAPSHWLFLVRGSVGPSFKRDLDHRRLTWCLWTATVAEEGIEACCNIARLSRLRILQELMFSHKRYRWNITSFFPPFVLVGPLVAVLFWSTPCFAFTDIVPRLQRNRYWWAILQAMAVDSFLLGRKGDPAVLHFPSRICADFIATILDKSPWDSIAIHIFLLLLGSLLKQGNVFEIFLRFSLLPPYRKLKLGKKFWIHVSNIVCGVREGVGPAWIEKRPEMQKCPKTFVHDCLKKRWEETRQFWGVAKPVKVFFSGSWWKIVIEQIFSQLFGVFWTWFKNSLETNDIHQKLWNLITCNLF